MQTIHMDEIDASRIGGILWKPIRSTLDVEAFGINAYVAADAGDRLFDEHDETEAAAGAQRHEELYVVLAGRAIFVGDGVEVDVPAGTIVFFKDATERRSARAAAPETTVLAIGGPVGEGYEVAPWEYWFRAHRALQQGRPEEAQAVAEEGLRRYPNDSRLRGLRQD